MPASEPRAIEVPVEGLSDGEIRLRLLAEADLPALIEAVQDPEIPRWTRIPTPYGEREAREWFERQAPGLGDGSMLNLVIDDVESGEMVGSIGIPRIEWDEGRCEFGYWTAREHRGRGITPRAILLLSAWVFDELGLERITIVVDVDNPSSKRAAEKAGFSFEGVLRSYLVNKNRRRDVAMYSLLRGEP